MTRDSKTLRIARLANTVSKRYGMLATDLEDLLRIERTLSRWNEATCGDSNATSATMIERDEDTGKCYRRTVFHRSGLGSRAQIPDRETGAQRRALAILARYPTAVPEFSGDPRGPALRLVHRDDLGDTPIHEYGGTGLAITVD